VKRHVGILLLVSVCAALLLASGCASMNTNVSRLKLGMTPDEVLKQIGKPFTIRAAKLYTGNEWTEVWEYLPPLLTLYPKTYWVYFEDGKVVQWGEPGDFAGQSGANVPISEYSSQKKAQ